MEVAIRNVKEAIKLYVEDLKVQGKEIPNEECATEYTINIKMDI